MQHPAMTINSCLQHCRTPDMQNQLRTAAEAAVNAGRVLQQRYEQPHQIHHKGAIDLVTEADWAAEKVILEFLQDNLPGIKVLSEESFASYNGVPEEPVWIIDPLDGTTNFAHNFPWFAVSIALYDKGVSQVGVIYSPIQRELFCAAHGGGAWLNDRRLQVSGVNALKNGLVATGFPYDIREKSDAVLTMLKKILTHAQGVRRPGAASLDLAYLACGRLDAFWEIGLKPWDTAAGYLLVEEAGGRLSDFRGSPFSPFFPELLASNTLLHDDLIALLHEFSTAVPQT
jgi:myo-inositol-1(or 4)-monophosphatase